MVSQLSKHDLCIKVVKCHLQSLKGHVRLYLAQQTPHVRLLDRNDLVVYPMDPMALTPSYTVEYPAIAGQERAPSRHIVMLGLCK